LLLVLIVDSTLHTVFNAIRSWSVEFDHGRVKVPWMLSKRVVIGSVYPLLVLAALVDMARRDVNDTGYFELCNYALALAVVIRNEVLWMPVSIFTQAVMSAGPVAYLFVAIILVVSGMMLVLLHGTYHTGDFYVDSQYADYFYSVTTMAMYMIGGANFVEAQETALEIHGAHALIFIAMTIVSLWFITAILITIFAQAYTNVAEGRMTSTRMQQWGSLTPIFYLNKSIECMDNPGTTRDEEYLTPTAFEQIMLQHTHCPDGPASWLNGLHDLLEDTLSKAEVLLTDGLPEHAKENFESELHALATVCAELQDEPQFQRMHIHGYFPESQLSPLGSWADRDAASCHHDRINMGLSRALVELGLSSGETSEQLEYVKSILGPMSDKDAALTLSMTACPLGVTKKNASTIIPVLLEIGHMADYGQIPEPGATPQWLHTVDDIEHATATKWHQIEMQAMVKTLASEVYMLDTESDNEITQQVIQLVGLIQLHKWRLLLLFQALDVDGSGQVDLFEFEWLWAFATVGGRLASKPLLQDEAELMLLESEIEEATDSNTGNDNTNAAFDLKALEAAHSKLQEHVDEQLGKSHDRYVIIVQLSSLANLAVAAALADADWHGNSSLFEVLLMLFPIFWTFEYGYLLLNCPSLDALQHPDKAVSQRASVLVLLFGVVGSVLMICDQGHDLTSENTQHALASATGFLFITRNLYFSRMVLAFSRVLVRCFALVCAIFMFMLVFCQASKDMFGDRVADMNGDLYFDTNSHSLITLFRLFTGAAWYTVMLRAAAATSEAALLWFLMFVFLFTMFCCELFVGVIISEFIEINSIKSPRLFNALEPIFEFGPTEREAVLAGLLQLNRKMQAYNRAFVAVLDNKPPASIKNRKTPGSQLAVPKRLHKSMTELFTAILSQLSVIKDNEPTPLYKESGSDQLDSRDNRVQAHISQCVPVLLMALGQELVSITKENVSGNFDETRKQHRKAVTQWVVGFMAAMCTEGITDHFNFVERSDMALKAQVLERFQKFEFDHERLASSAEWSNVCHACRKAVDKIFDLYEGEPWLEPSDSRSADLCTRQLCSLLALDELVFCGEIFYQQATSDVSKELTQEQAIQAHKWHRPFIWGMRMFQVMHNSRNGSSREQLLSTTIDDIVAAALENGIDITDTAKLTEFTEHYASANRNLDKAQRTANSLMEPTEVELLEMKTDETHALPEFLEMKTDTCFDGTSAEAGQEFSEHLDNDLDNGDVAGMIQDGVAQQDVLQQQFTDEGNSGFARDLSEESRESRKKRLERHRKKQALTSELYVEI
jgi:hypothetical protein